MSERTITIGGRERQIHLTLADAINLQTRFEFPAMLGWVMRDVLGLDPEEGARNKMRPLARVALIAAALNRARGRKETAVTEAQVADWWDELSAAERSGQAAPQARREILWSLYELIDETGIASDEPSDPELLGKVRNYFFFGDVKGEQETTKKQGSEQPSSAPSLRVIPAASNG